MIISLHATALSGLSSAIFSLGQPDFQGATAGIKVYIALRERDFDARFVEYLEDLVSEQGCNFHAVGIGHENPQFEI